MKALNDLPAAEAREGFLACCGAARWADAMVAVRPFEDQQALFDEADRIWSGLQREDYLEAFAAHPRIGDAEALRGRFRSDRFAHGEQSGAAGADDAVLAELARANRQYEERFGYIFIVCATGKSAREMLDLLKARLGNRPEDELQVAAEEQAKITRLRLQKLLGS